MAFEDKFGPKLDWMSIDPYTNREYNVLPDAIVRFVELMENITPADLGLAVPYIWIYEVVDGKLGKRISDDLYQPPKFGQPLDKRFGERPNVSIENVKVKYEMGQGWVLFRRVDLNIVVHKPDQVFGGKEGTMMQSLLDFTKEHALVYGWSGGGPSSVISNGPPPENKDAWKYDPLTKRFGWPASTPHVPLSRGLMQSHVPEPGTDDPVPPDYRQAMPVKGIIKIKVVNYNFSIEPDMQVKFNLQAFEDGELAIRDAVIFNNRKVLSLFDQSSITLDDAGKLFEQVKAIYVDEFANRAEMKQIEIFDQKTKKKTIVSEKFIKLEHVFNLLFSDPILYACRALGYTNVKLHLGMFNSKCPTTNAAFGKQVCANRSIADFMVPLQDITDMLNKLNVSGAQMTVQAMIRRIMYIVNAASTWESGPRDTFQTPQLVLLTRYNPDMRFAMFQLVDRLQYIVNAHLGDLDFTHYDTSAKIRRELEKRQIPRISFVGKLSYIKDSKFEVVNDEQMKSIFINRQINKTRAEIAASDTRNSQLYGGMPGFSMLYRSALKGTITILGNFAFDVRGIVYVEFGIPVYDGPFFVVGREDNVSPEGFYTTLTLQACATDPIYNSAGKEMKLPKWVTGGGERSMVDWIKGMILEMHPDELKRKEDERRLQLNTSSDALKSH